MFFTKKEQWLVAGLGNPGKKYDKTRHNAGFHAIEAIAKENGDDLSREKGKFNALYLNTEIGDRKCLLLRPLTYMNLSGEAIAAAASYYKIPVEHIIVICDDITNPPGKMRIKRKGSAGGHNGLKSIIEHIGEDFPRIRLGVGAKPEGRDLADWVLSDFGAEEQKQMQYSYGCCFEAVKLIMEGSVDKAMNKFNS